MPGDSGHPRATRTPSLEVRGRWAHIRMHQPIIQPGLKTRSMHPHGLGLRLQLQSLAPAVHPLCLGAFSAQPVDALLTFHPLRGTLSLLPGFRPPLVCLANPRPPKRSRSNCLHFRVSSNSAWGDTKSPVLHEVSHLVSFGGSQTAKRAAEALRPVGARPCDRPRDHELFPARSRLIG